MKKISIIGSFALSLTVMTLVGCSDGTDAPDTPAAEEDTFLSIDVAMAGSTKSAELKYSFQNNDMVLVRVDDYKTYEFETAPAQLINGKWEFIDGRIDLSGCPKGSDTQWSDALGVTVMYPYDIFAKAEQVSLESGNYIKEITGILDQKDILMSRPVEVNRYNKYAEVTMKHLLSQVAIMFFNKTPFDIDIRNIRISNPVISYGDVSYEIPLLSKSASIDSDGELECILKDTGSIVTEDGYNVPINNHISFNYLVNPVSDDLEAMKESTIKWAEEHGITVNQEKLGLRVNMDVDGIPLSFSLPFKIMQPGIGYNCNATILKNHIGIYDVQVGDVTVVPWNPNESGNIDVID